MITVMKHLREGRPKHTKQKEEREEEKDGGG